MAALGLGLVVLVFGSIWLLGKDKKTQEEAIPEIILEESKMLSREQPQAGMSEAEKEAIDQVFERVGAEMTLIADVTGGTSLGTAFRATEEEMFYHKVEASGLPSLEKGFFYEGWLVGDEGFFSTGRVLVIDGAGKLYFKALDDKSSFNGVVITIEPEDGNPAPDKHILEGSF